MKKLLPALFLFAACASAPPARPPQWSEIPAPILNALCAKLHSEGVSHESQISLLKTTRPLITANSIGGLGRAFGKQGDSAMMADVLNSSLQPLPLAVTQGGNCNWRPVDRIDARRDHETLIVEVSAPFVNPFERGEAGLFARMSVGGQAPQWYWIPVAEHNGAWAIGMVLPLDLHEE